MQPSASTSAPPDVASSDFFRELDTQLLVHELKNPLALIEATTRTLLEHTSRLGPLTERQERALRRVLRGAVRGQGLVNQLLEVGRAESSQFFHASFAPVEAVFRVLLEAVEASDAALAARLSEESADRAKLGVLAQAVAQRRKEIRIRVAPGGTPSAPFRMVCGRGVALAAVGATAGVLVTVALAGYLQSLFFEVSGVEPAVLVAVVLLMLCVATAAAGLPAWRAIRLNPTLAIRSD